MQLPQQIRERYDAEDIPPQAYALVGATLVLRRRTVATLQTAAQAVNRISLLPADAAGALRSAQSAPGEIRSQLAVRYGALSQEGQRAVATWHAERLLNDRADRITRAVTPGAARATVSARDAARRAAGSPTGQRIGEAGRRARRGASQAWRDYLAAVDEAGAARWGDAAINGAAGASALR